MYLLTAALFFLSGYFLGIQETDWCIGVGMAAFATLVIRYLSGDPFKKNPY